MSFHSRERCGKGYLFSPFLFLIAAEGLNVMMNATFEAHLFYCYHLGGNASINLFHLQIDDDELLLREKSWANVRVLKVVLILFEVIFGLKHKIMFVWVNVATSWLTQTISILNCKNGNSSFMYLRKLQYWYSLIDRVNKRISGLQKSSFIFGWVSSSAL